MTAAHRPRPEPMLSVEDVAARLKVSKMTVYRRAQRGEIRAYRIGHLVRIPESALRDFLKDADMRRMLP